MASSTRSTTGRRSSSSTKRSIPGTPVLGKSLSKSLQGTIHRMQKSRSSRPALSTVLAFSENRSSCGKQELSGDRRRVQSSTTNGKLPQAAGSSNSPVRTRPRHLVAAPDEGPVAAVAAASAASRASAEPHALAAATAGAALRIKQQAPPHAPRLCPGVLSPGDLEFPCRACRVDVCIYIYIYIYIFSLMYACIHVYRYT